ncbi:hypothetical protein GR28A_00057 [Vibrio phage vB_VcorM_GR28A]|nr:hypothetical protein GR28A_00057 [Vibrio phage vB_VcorM_GR28A]
MKTYVLYSDGGPLSISAGQTVTISEDRMEFNGDCEFTIKRMAWSTPAVFHDEKIIDRGDWNEYRAKVKYTGRTKIIHSRLVGQICHGRTFDEAKAYIEDRYTSEEDEISSFWAIMAFLGLCGIVSIIIAGLAHGS